ncbi:MULTISPECIES: ATP-binding protein [Flavobacteriaceae]|uniref:tetratricopeptide repeat-containing sensor histidine kinase n=1 Tax=Flavobacteriaceae TaxID=49546 RepID=UPI0014915769|nr:MULTISPECIES: ATP-binding protein [Allomuricauda]MDC6366674.1 hypothetical protein [Muricauda sp. AC10]
MPIKNLLAAFVLFTLASQYTCQTKKTQLKTNTGFKFPHHSIDTVQNHDELLKIIASYRYKKVDTTLLKAIWKKSDLFSTGNNLDSLLKYDRLLLTSAVKSNHLNYQAKGESNLAYDFRELQQLDSAFYYYQKSKNSYLKLADSNQVGIKLFEIGKIQYRQNDFYGSKESITEALTFFNNEKDKTYQIWCWNELGNNYASLDDFENAKNNYKKAIRFEEKLVDKIKYVNNLAVLYSDNQNYPKAIELIDSIIKNLPNEYSNIEYARLVHNKAEAQWRLDNSNIIEDYAIALKIRKAENDQWGLLSSYRSLAEYYENIAPEKSIKYLDSLLYIAKKNHISKAEIEALQILFRLKPDNIVYKNRYIFLQDSLHQQELKVKNQFAYLKYQDEEEKSRLLALETETAKQEAQLAQEETQKILFLSTSALLLMGGVSLFFLLKQRHRKEKLKEVYNTEKRISQRLHDGLANDIFSLMAKVENKEQVKDTEFLDHLETIYSKTRDISHENSPVKTHEHFLEELETLIRSFHSNGVSIVTKGLGDIGWEDLSEPKCVALHRTIKELLVNMKKHSQASLISLRFSSDTKNIQIDYKDNGIGFPTKINYGMGLHNVENRIQSCGGTFTFIPKQGNGAEIRVTIPHKSRV